MIIGIRLSLINGNKKRLAPNKAWILNTDASAVAGVSYIWIDESLWADNQVWKDGN